MMVFGEDVAKKGGVYGVTRGLQKRFGPARVFDTLLDEQSILGLALGSVCASCCRCPRSNISRTCTTRSTRSAARRRLCRSSREGAYRNPLVLRVADVDLPEGVRRPLPQRQRGGGAASNTCL